MTSSTATAEATPAELARATGLSRGYCAQIRDLAGQRQIADTFDADAVHRIADLAHSLDACERLEDARLVEAHAAAAYWGAWRGVRAEFTTRDADRVPEHWTRFSQRMSPTHRVAPDRRRPGAHAAFDSHASRHVWGTTALGCPEDEPLTPSAFRG